ITVELLAWGSAAGIAGAIGVVALYAGFTQSTMSVVSPIAAVGAATWPVLWSMALGDIPGGLVLVGIVVGIVAIWVVSGGSRTTLVGDTVGLKYGVIAGLGFGAMLILLSFTSDGSNVWALLPARISGAVFLIILASRLGQPLHLPRRSFLLAILAGTATVVGNGLFIISAGLESLAVATVLAAMVPATTVLRSWLVLRERLTPRRMAGLALALVAVGLVAAG
ncbi:MAG: DMT family transporter, partial [Acidimicrobiia bacterium]